MDRWDGWEKKIFPVKVKFTESGLRALDFLAKHNRTNRSETIRQLILDAALPLMKKESHGQD